MDNKNLKIKQTLTLAYENHIKNNLDLAESLYNKILKIDIGLFPLLNKTIQNNKITFDDYLNEQKWHLIKKKQKQRINKIKR